MDVGYNKVLAKKAHTEPSEWVSVSNWPRHIKRCTECNVDMKAENCRDSSGNKLGCGTGKSGTCVVCGAVKDGTKHDSAYVTKTQNGKRYVTCNSCGKLIVTYDEPTVTVLSDTSVKSSFHVYLESGITLSDTSISTGTWYNIAGCSYTKPVKTKQADGSYIIEATATYTKGVTVPNVYDLCIYIDYAVNGVQNNYLRIDSRVKSDNTIPKSQSITVQNNDIVNGFARKATITAKFTEEIDEVVQMALYDGNTMIVDWGTANKNGTTFTRTFDVVSETASTKELTVKAKDRCGNIGVGTVTIEKLDSKAPQIVSTTELDNNWNIRKTIKLEILDEGIGEVQIAFNDPNKYENTEKLENKYVKTYNFIGDAYEDVTGAIYLKDGLGNVTTQKLAIGKIDSTSPNITNVAKSGNSLTIEANDICEKIGKEGSGVASYAISTSKELPSDAEFQSKNTFNIESGKTYYVWVKDNAGNISERYEV